MKNSLIFTEPMISSVESKIRKEQWEGEKLFWGCCYSNHFYTLSVCLLKFTTILVGWDQKRVQTLGTILYTTRARRKKDLKKYTFTSYALGLVTILAAFLSTADAKYSLKYS